MTSMNRGIPTLYNGTLFRSRLEARWAVLFDGLKWPWTYEPIDLDFYVPDFVLLFAAPIAIEVKPELDLTSLHRHAQKIIACGWTGEALALGAMLFPGNVIGSLIEHDGPEHVTGTGRVFQCINCGAVSLHAADGSWKCRVNGCYAGNAHVGDVPADAMSRIWTDAGNRVQWKGSVG